MYQQNGKLKYSKMSKENLKVVVGSSYLFQPARFPKYTMKAESVDREGNSVSFSRIEGGEYVGFIENETSGFINLSLDVIEDLMEEGKIVLIEE